MTKLQIWFASLDRLELFLIFFNLIIQYFIC